MLYSSAPVGGGSGTRARTVIAMQADPNPMKRKRKPIKSKNPKKKTTMTKPSGAMAAVAEAKRRKPSKRMLKLFKKRAQNYHSDSDDDDEEEVVEEGRRGEATPSGGNDEDGSTDSERGGGSEGDDEGDGEGGHRGGITRFDEGCRAFRVAFSKIMKKKLPYDALGPMLSAHKKLVVEKLAEEEAEHKAKGDAKKEKILASEKGHVKLASFLDAKEKSLIKIATKGVVRLFNEVSKAQISQRGLNPSRTKVAKELAKQRKQTFSPELKKSSTQGHGDHLPFNSSKLSNSVEKENDDEPGWAPLRDSYMLTSSKLKDWDKMPDPAASVGQDVFPMESSSSDEE
ncbi:RRP15-like protein [Ananas comosus]|uniref:RRP15-like protein n=1 Tax=Ananas comosus TaxID=4615 RepID=A0A6P5FEY3_ANACO|nr:RRP15-like protein [Ananas comosus]XP_020094178.1 RRP15-like protein [Ananas comosus]